MKPSDFVVVQPYLEKAVGDIDDLLNQLQHNAKVEQGDQEFCDAWDAGQRGDDLPALEHTAIAWGHPWAQSAMTVAAGLGKAGMELQALGIESELRKLPDHFPPDPDSLREQNHIAQAAAEQVKAILTGVMGPCESVDEAGGGDADLARLKEKYHFRHTGAVYEVRFDGESGTIDAKLDGAKYIFELLQHPNHTYAARELHSLVANPAPRKVGEVGTQATPEPTKKGRIGQDEGELMDLKKKLQEEKADLQQAIDDENAILMEETQKAIDAIMERIRQLAGWNGQIRKEDPFRKPVSKAIQLVIDKCQTEYNLPRLAQFLGEYIHKGSTPTYRPVNPAPNWQF